MPLWGKQKVSQLNSKRLSCFSHRCICRTGRKGMVKRMKISPAEVRPWSFGSSKWIRWLGLGLIEVVSMNFVSNLFELMGTPCPAEFLLKHPPEICTRKPENHGIWLRQWQCSRSCPWPRWIPMSRISANQKKQGDWLPAVPATLSLLDWRFQSRSSLACKELDLRYLHLGEETHQLVRNPQ